MNNAQFKQHIKTIISIFGEEKALLKICNTSHKYLKQNKIFEISANDFAELSGLTKEYSKEILLKLNSGLFANK